ncbi:MAG: hypothetical protein KJ771_05580, partial [Nanoarchaeota archaeon]|nr:hypothetical protein [Nanoarchaeota archaeon]
FKDKYLILLVIFIIFFLFFTNFRIHATQGWDESRHAVQGHIFYDYFQTLLSGDFMSFRTFMEHYQEKGYNAGWFMFDPPFHAIIQGITFVFLGASPVTASIATQLFIILGAFLLYFLSLEILKKKHLALSVVMLYLLCPFLVNIGGLSMLSIPISFMMVGWYYFTFHRQGKTYALKLSPRIKLSLKTNVLWGALFLTAATLMKYQNLIYAATFYALYIIYKIVKEKKFSLSMFKIGLWQGIIVLLISAWWIKFSLFDYGFLKRMAELSLSYTTPNWFSPSYTFAYFIQTFKETHYLAILAFIPILVWFYKKRESFLSKNIRLFIFVLSVYLVATFLITSQQLRYAIALLPFVFILMVKGIDDFAIFLKNKIKLNYKILFFILIISLTVFSGLITYNLMAEQVQKRGIYNPELVDYLSAIPNPKFLINVNGDLIPYTPYYYNEDLFIFESMIANERNGIHNPKEMEQIVQKIPGQGIQDYNEFAASLEQNAQQIKTVLVIFKKSDPRIINLEQLDQAIVDVGFNKTELTWYYVYEKG